MTIKIINFQTNQGQKSENRLADNPDRLISGEPVHQTVVHFSNDANAVVAGMWTSTKGKFHVAKDRDEFCYIVSGHVRLIDSDGVAETFKTGDAYVIPNGFRGSWDVIETTTKYFTINKYNSQ